MRTTLWSAQAGDIPASLAVTNNLNASTNPLATSDTSLGYEAGSQWINTTTDQAFVCVDATKGKAIWTLFASGQGAPAAKTTSATLTAADLLNGIITVNQGGGAASNQQLPDCAALDAALPFFQANSCFDFSVINISTVDAEDATLTTNNGWSLVGAMDIPAKSALGSLNSSGRFRARKTGAAAWTLYRLS